MFYVTYCFICFINSGNHVLISKRVFSDFSQTTPTLRIKIHAQSLLNMTQQWYQNLSMFVKSWGMWLCFGTSTLKQVYTPVIILSWFVSFDVSVLASLNGIVA